jgi:hypothetical protein
MDLRVGRRAIALGLAGATAALSAKGGAQSRKVEPMHQIEVIDVRTFGAKGDGVTDDAPAINAALDTMRAQRQDAPSWVPGFRMEFRGGTFRIGSPLNLTFLQHFNVVIDGGGAVLLGATDGKPVIDALGSRWLHFQDLYIFGDKDHPPNIGLQIGRAVTGLPADNYILENVSLNGVFSLACIYNFAAETTVFLHCTAWNKSRSAGAYCLIQDGLNHFAASSVFVSGRPAGNMAESFNENLLINCDFRSNGDGSPLWLASTSRHQFQRCYAAAENAPGCVLHVGGEGIQCWKWTATSRRRTCRIYFYPRALRSLNSAALPIKITQHRRLTPYSRPIKWSKPWRCKTLASRSRGIEDSGRGYLINRKFGV